jgi:DNA-directed RNA polymerase subunit omega
MIEPKIETLIENAESKFTLVILAAKRGRQINSYFSQLGEGTVEFTPPQIQLGSERAPKALSIALEEIASGQVTFERTTDGIK